MRPGLTIFALAVALGGCATVRGGPQTGPVARGEAVARRVCAACHAMGEGGDSPSPRAPGFASVELQHTAGLTGRVADLTRNGHYGMPPLTLTPEEVSDVAAYIESLGVRDSAKPRGGGDA